MRGSGGRHPDRNSLIQQAAGFFGAFNWFCTPISPPTPLSHLVRYVPSTNTANAAVWGPCHTPPYTPPPLICDVSFFPVSRASVSPRALSHTIPTLSFPNTAAHPVNPFPCKVLTPGEPDPWKQCPHHGRYGERVINHVWGHLTTQAVPCVNRLPCLIPSCNSDTYSGRINELLADDYSS